MLNNAARRILNLGMPHAASLALVFAWCAGGGTAFLPFLIGSLMGAVTADSVEALCRLALEGAPDDALRHGALAVTEVEDGRAVEEMADAAQRQAPPPEGLSADLLKELHERREAERRDLTRGVRDILAVVGAPSFDIIGGLAELLDKVPKVRSHGLAHVAARPEAPGLANWLAEDRRRKALLRGRALSGKTFVAFKTAQAWLVRGGTVAWFHYNADLQGYIAAIERAATPAEALPLVVWDIPFERGLDPGLLEQLSRYPGPVLTTVRVGDQAPHPDELRGVQDNLGYRLGTWNQGRPGPAGPRLNLFLGPVQDIGLVLSRINQARGLGLSLTDDGREAIARRMAVGNGAQGTTLLGLGRAYLLALARLGARPVDRLAVESLEGREHREELTGEDLVRDIFSRTVTTEEAALLAVLRLYKQWTHKEAIHEALFPAALRAYRLAEGLNVYDSRKELLRRGVLVADGPWLWVWHDLQLDAAPPVDGALADKALAHTVAALQESLGHDGPGLDELARAAGDFANALFKNGEWNPALDLQKAVLPAFRKAAGALGAGPREQSNVATACNNLAVLLYKMNSLTEAEAYYSEALDIQRRLAEDQPKEYEPDIAMTCSNLGSLLEKDRTLWPRAEAHYEEALKIYCRLVKDQPKVYEPYLAITSNNLGILLREMERWPEAEEHYNQALEIRRRLAKDQPKAYEPDVATTCNNLAGLLYAMERLNEAEAHVNEALEIRRRLAKDQPKAYEPMVAKTIYNLSLLLMAQSRHTEAAPLLGETFSLCFALFMERPSVYSEHLENRLKTVAALARDESFAGRGDWLAGLWSSLLGQFQGEAWRLCKKLAPLLEQTGCPGQALEAITLLALALEARGEPEAAEIDQQALALAAAHGLDHEAVRQRMAGLAGKA